MLGTYIRLNVKENKLLNKIDMKLKPNTSSILLNGTDVSAQVQYV